MLTFDTVNALADYIAGVIAFGFVLLPVGYVVATAANPCDFDRRSPSEQISLSILTATATVPILVYYIIRAVPSGSVQVFAFVALPFALYGYLRRRKTGRERHSWLQAGIGWAVAAVIVGLLLIDIRSGDQLQNGSIVYDYAKDVSVIDAISRTGIPPINPSFLDGRPQPLFYYYYWFAVCSFVDQATSGLIGPNASIKASVFWALANVMALVHCAIFSGSVRFPADTRNKWIGAAITGMLVSGLDVVPVSIQAVWHLAASQPVKLPYALAVWNGGGHISSWLGAITWVPHHVAGFVSATFSLFVLRRGADLPLARYWRIVVLAGFGFASAAGLSIWVTIVAAMVAATWCLILIYRRWYREACLFVAAGIVGLVLALPFLAGLIGADHSTKFPLALHPRPFGPLAPFEHRVYGPLLIGITRLAALPVTYAVSFGYYLVALVPYLRWRRMIGLPFERDEMFWLVCAAVPLVACSLLTSQIQNNDFGWRGLLFTQFVLLVYSVPAVAAVLHQRDLGTSALRHWRGLILAITIVGFLGASYDVIALRMGVFDERNGRLGPWSDQNYREHAARMWDALAWISMHTPRSAIVQHNPGPGADIGTLEALYVHRQALLSDRGLGMLYGVSQAMYRRLAQAITHIFVLGTPLKDAVAIVNSRHIDIVIVLARDPVWNDPNSWPSRVRPAYANSEVKIFAASAMRETCQDCLVKKPASRARPVKFR